MRTAIILIALLLTPTAMAATPTPIEARLELSEAINLIGKGDMRLTHGGLDLAPDERPATQLTLAWASADGTIQTTQWTTALGARFNDPPAEPEPVRTGAANLRRITCAPGCQVLLYTREDGNITIQAAFNGTLARTSEPTIYWAEMDRGSNRSFDHTFPSGTTTLGVNAATQAEGTVEANGRQFLFAKNAILHLDGAADINLRDETTAIVGPAGNAATTTTSRFAVILLQRTALTTDLQNVRVLAPDATLDADSTLHASDATGHITLPDHHQKLEHGTLDITGRFELTLRADDRASTPLRPTEPTQTLTLHGTADEVWTNGMRIATTTTAPANAPAAAIIAAAILIAFRAALPLYTRLKRSNLLDNDNRRRLWEDIEQHPGRNAADISRTTQLARIVVRHHLAALTTHGLITCKPHGRTKLYYPTHNPPHDAELHAALTDDNRQRIAKTLAQLNGPTTQTDIAHATGISPRLVSYHLARLEALHLVHSQGEWRRKYHATPRLMQALTSETARPETP